MNTERHTHTHKPARTKWRTRTLAPSLCSKIMVSGRPLRTRVPPAPLSRSFFQTPVSRRVERPDFRESLGSSPLACGDGREGHALHTFVSTESTSRSLGEIDSSVPSSYRRDIDVSRGSRVAGAALAVHSPNGGSVESPSPSALSPGELEDPRSHIFLTPEVRAPPKSGAERQVNLSEVRPSIDTQCAPMAPLSNVGSAASVESSSLPSPGYNDRPNPSAA